MTLDQELVARATTVVERLKEQGLRMATAESCTGGLISAALTAIPGSSDVLDRGFVTYSNEAKHELIGVPADMIAEYGAVSEPVARAMADGALAAARVDRAVSVTGVAGPGQSERKPAGLVFIGFAGKGIATQVREHRFSGDRDAVRLASALAALDMLVDAPLE
ncbi:MAG: CinA family protein [Alphaproteobacteria bacterium]